MSYRIPFNKPFLTGKETEYIRDAVNSGKISGNGDFTKKCHRFFEERYGLQFVDATVKFRDYPEMAELDVKLVLDAIWEDGPALSEQKQQNLYQQVRSDYLDLRYANKIKEAMKEDPYFNALQVKFAYAVTCHKAQGGQWPVALIDQGYLTEDMLGVDYYRWLYTAFTRASEKLFLMEFDEKFFE